jgi:hypothetical protein
MHSGFYRPEDWYWLVAGDDTRLWSSRRAAYVLAEDAIYQAWLTEGHLPTRIADEVELVDVLLKAYPAGAPAKVFTAEELLAAARRIDPGAAEAMVPAEESPADGDPRLPALAEQLGLHPVVAPAPDRVAALEEENAALRAALVRAGVVTEEAIAAEKG